VRHKPTVYRNAFPQVDVCPTRSRGAPANYLSQALAGLRYRWNRCGSGLTPKVIFTRFGVRGGAVLNSTG
jgi:hypothetical protein